MKKAARLFCALLVVLLLASAFAGCADNGKNDVTTETEAVVNPTESSDEVTEDPNAVKSGLPKDLNYDTTVNVLVWDDVEHEEFDSEGQTGEIINDAIYARNLAVEQMLGVTINNIRRLGNGDHRTEWANHVKAQKDGGLNTYDCVAGYSLSIAQNACDGTLANLLNDVDFKYLDLSQPYWAALLLKQSTIQGKLFFASGDISRNALEMMYVCFVNRYLLEAHGLQNPQELVASRQWTLEKFMEMCSGIYESAGQGTTPDVMETYDTFGYMSYGIHLDPWFYACGALLCEPDADGNLVKSESFDSVKVLETIEKFQTLWKTQDAMVGSGAGKHQAAFRDNRLLFCTERARSSHKTFANNVDCKFYVVPTPLFDSDQENYYTCMANPFTLFGVMSDVEDREMAGAYLQAMAYQGYENITPAVFELSLKTRYVDDPVSSQMYDLIRNSITYDPGRIFCDRLAGQDAFRKCVASDSASWVSARQSYTKSVSTKIKPFNSTFKAIKG